MADNEELMAPEASPGTPGKSGVRRLNKRPLMIVGLIGLVFVGMVAMVAIKRSQPVVTSTPDDKDKPKQTAQGATSRSMAREIAGGSADGLVPPVAAPATEPASSVQGIQVAPVANPDAPPTPPGTRSLATGPSTGQRLNTPSYDPDLDRMRIEQMRELQKAVQARSSQQVEIRTSRPIAAGMQGNGLTTNATQSKDDIAARLADVRRQIAEGKVSDPEAVYKAQLERARASVGGAAAPAAAAGTALTTSAGTTGRADIQQFAGNGGDRWNLGNDVQAPRTPYTLIAGSVIPAGLVSSIKSEQPGEIIGTVTRDVYDTPRGKWVVIPQGTRLYGVYSNNVLYGQTTILVAFQRLIFPDGKTLDIGSMRGADGAGNSGFSDQTDNHYLRIFGSSFLMAGITAGVALTQDRAMGNGGTTTYTAPTFSSEMSQALGQQLGQTTSQMVAKNLNIAPTQGIRPGYRFNIVVTKDIPFTRPYQKYDY
ncbi:conjugal transfer protein TrbI [Ralstonia pickettii]|jgi:type IV secretory pathway VirB10-like protein|uniref:TrbI/VirB10 family protein n=1 Tax=Ralstonia pickettii TaxID=329 RepID=UPI000BDA8054|nr:TrbI/VirB10 family protein [Ralstonia pickettii]MBT2180955.1 conjugal transfer protein TrbI [Ralstonia pickettii]POH90103.1 conjugal transfer protein TrbI [Ralstonia pickettii]